MIYLGYYKELWKTIGRHCSPVVCALDSGGIQFNKDLHGQVLSLGPLMLQPHRGASPYIVHNKEYPPLFLGRNSRSSILVLSSGWGHCIVYLGKTLKLHGASLHSGVFEILDTCKFNAGGNPAMD